MPQKILVPLEELHGKQRRHRVVVLGASFPGRLKETAFSGVFSLFAISKDFGKIVYGYDPQHADDDLVNLCFARIPMAFLLSLQKSMPTMKNIHKFIQFICLE